MTSGRLGGWGGARAGAGRPASGPVPSEPHKTRPTLSPRHPVHVTARLVRATHRDLGRTYQLLRYSLHRSLARSDFRIVHIALVRGKLELIVEADNKLALARGMQGFQVSLARALNRAARRRGTVFPDRYRMRILTTRSAVRATIGGLPLARTPAWPQTWLLTLELARAMRGTSASRASPLAASSRASRPTTAHPPATTRAPPPLASPLRTGAVATMPARQSVADRSVSR
ncbi:MAG TPA: hypothetical protein VIV11_25080 [Kofleriaceae bacterium]